MSRGVSSTAVGGSHRVDQGQFASASKGSWRTVLAAIARDRVNQVVFLVTAITVALVYAVLLPFAYTQQISFANWQYLDARLVAFAGALGISIAAVITLQAHALRRIARTAGGGIAGIGGVLAVLPTMLCCSPLVPTLVALLGLSTAASYRTTGTIQYFFATKENLILGASLGVVILSTLWSFRKIVTSTCCGTSGCDAAISSGTEAAAVRAAARRGVNNEPGNQR